VIDHYNGQDTLVRKIRLARGELTVSTVGFGGIPEQRPPGQEAINRVGCGVHEGKYPLDLPIRQIIKDPTDLYRREIARTQLE
jgi:hypothetical protein